MVKEELIIDNQRVELLQSLNPNLTFNIADIANPDKRKSDFSKTIVLPGSKTINKIFEHIFEVNLGLQTFNPNLKTDVVYLVDGEINLDGYLQLKKITVIDKDDVTYNVTLTGRVGDFISNLSNSLLTDIDFSSLDHLYDGTRQAATWVAPTSINVLGYVYPMINYGMQVSTTPVGERWKVTDFFPAITVKKYIDEIFDSVDYTYTSTFFDSDFFESLIIPYSAKDFKITMEDIEDIIFMANDPIYLDYGTGTATETQMSIYGNNYGTGPGGAYGVPPATNAIRVTNEVYDVGANYDSTNFSDYLVPSTGVYNFEARLTVQGKFRAPATIPSAVGNDGKWYAMGGICGTIDIMSETEYPAHSEYYEEGSVAFGIFPVANAPGGVGVVPNGYVTTTASPTTPSNEYFYPSVSNHLINIEAQNTNSECNSFTVNATNVPLKQNTSGSTIDGKRIFLRWGGGYHQMADYQTSVTPISGSYPNGMPLPYPGNYTTRNKMYWIDSTGTEAAYSTGASPYGSGVGYDACNLLGLTGYFKCQVSNVGLTEGEVVSMNRTVPEKIKQKDFFMSLVKMFNLYVATNTSNDSNLLIEPRDDFYLDGFNDDGSTNIVDWSLKLDLSKPLDTLPMGALDSIDYKYSYKEDKDYYNTLYKDTWARIYGDKLYDEYANDFLKKTHKTDIIFSPTPSVGQSWYDRVIPTIIKTDSSGQVQKSQCNIRILQYGGMKDTIPSWEHDAVTGGAVYDTYPYSGMYDDPYSPTVDIGFGLTREIYWDDTNAPSGGTITFTNNNLFNKYHRKFIEEITDKDSKIIKGWFYLKPTDIRDLSFRKLWFFENSYFRLNKIINYNPSNPITQCEFLKIKLADTFVPTALASDGGSVDIGVEPAPYYGNTGGVIGGNTIGSNRVSVLGINNSVSRSATGVMIVGDGNTVLGAARNVIIQGNDNFISAGVTNVSLLNTNGMTVDNGGVSYIDGMRKGNVEVVNSTTTVDEGVELYLCDTSAGGFNMELPTPSYIGQKWVFKSVEASNTLTIRATPYTIDGAAEKTLTTLHETKVIMWDGNNYYIISEF